MVPHRSPINTSRWLHSRLHPILTEVPQKFLKQCLFLWLPSIQSLPKHPILTEVPSDLCDRNGPTSEPIKYKSTGTISSTSFRNLSKQCLFLWLPSIPVSLSPPQMHLRGRTIKQCLFLIMVPHRGPINTSRWLHSRRHPILTEVPQKFLKQCLFLWLPSIQSLPKHPILTEVPSDLCDHSGPTLEPNKYKSTRTISSTSFRNLSKQCLSL